MSHHCLFFVIGDLPSSFIFLSKLTTVKFEKINLLKILYLTFIEEMRDLVEVYETVSLDTWEEIIIPWKNKLDEAFVDYLLTKQEKKPFANYIKELNFKIDQIIVQIITDFPDIKANLADNNVLKAIFSNIESHSDLDPLDIPTIMANTLIMFKNRVSTDFSILEDFFHYDGNDLLEKVSATPLTKVEFTNPLKVHKKQRKSKSRVTIRKDLNLKKMLWPNKPDEERNRLYNKMLKVLQEQYTDDAIIDASFIIKSEHNMDYEWTNKRSIPKKYVAGFISVCIYNLRWMRPNFLSEEYKYALLNTFNIKCPTKYLQPFMLEKGIDQKFKKPFYRLQSIMH